MVLATASNLKITQFGEQEFIAFFSPFLSSITRSLTVKQPRVRLYIETPGTEVMLLRAQRAKILTQRRRQLGGEKEPDDSGRSRFTANKPAKFQNKPEPDREQLGLIGRNMLWSCQRNSAVLRYISQIFANKNKWVKQTQSVGIDRSDRHVRQAPLS